MTKAEILALQPGRELDICVAEVLTGQQRFLSRYDPMTANGEPQFYFGYPVGHDIAPAYSTDIAAAWQVVEAMRPEYGFWIDGDDDYVVEFQHGMPGMADYRHGRASAPTAPEAICKAALLAKLESGAA